jgi:uncharacterized protein
MAPAEPLRIQVVYGPQGGAVEVVELELLPGATAATALDASGLMARHGLSQADLRFGVWGRVCGEAQVLRDRDRVEIYRPLLVDPKEARRQRYRHHREAAAERTATAASGTRKR